MQNCLHTQTTFFDSPFWLPAALNDYITFEYYSAMWYFFPVTFFILLSYVPIQPKLCWLLEMFMYSSEMKKKKKNVLFWEIHHFLPGTCGCEDGSCLLTTWESEKCLRTVTRWWDSGWGSQYEGKIIGKILPKRLYQSAFPGWISYFFHLLE